MKTYFIQEEEKAVYVYLGKSAADKEDPEVGKLLALASVLHNPEASMNYI